MHRFQIWYCYKEWLRQREKEMNTLIRKKIAQRTERIVTPTSWITMLICFNTILCRRLLIYMSQTRVFQAYDSGEEYYFVKTATVVLTKQTSSTLDEITLRHPRNFTLARVFSQLIIFTLGWLCLSCACENTSGKKSIAIFSSYVFAYCCQMAIITLVFFFILRWYLYENIINI